MSGAGRRALALLVEPQRPEARPETPLAVGVTGLSSGCGASTVAQALALELPGAQVTDGIVPGRDGVLVAVADHTGVPVLAGLVIERLARRHPHVVLVANRPDDPHEWEATGAVCLPQSRLGMILLGRGHRPWGPFGTAMRRLTRVVQAV